MTDHRPVPDIPFRPLVRGSLIATAIVSIGVSLMLSGCGAGEAFILDGLDSPAGTLVEPGTEATAGESLTEESGLVETGADTVEYSAFADPRLPSPPVSRYAQVDRDRAESAQAAGATVRRVGGEYHVSYPMRDVRWDGTIETLWARYGPHYPGFRRLCRHIPHVGTGPEVSAEDALEWAGYQPTSQGVFDLEATCSPLYVEYLAAHPDEGGGGWEADATCDLFGLRPGPAPSDVLQAGVLIRVGDLDRARMCCWSAAVTDPFSASRPARYTAACTDAGPPPPPPPSDPVCGDGTCDQGEDCESCPSDCGPCDGPPPPDDEEPPTDPPSPAEPCDLSPVIQRQDALAVELQRLADALADRPPLVCPEPVCHPAPCRLDCDCPSPCPDVDCGDGGTVPPPSDPPPPSGGEPLRWERQISFTPGNDFQRFRVPASGPAPTLLRLDIAATSTGPQGYPPRAQVVFGCAYAQPGPWRKFCAIWQASPRAGDPRWELHLDPDPPGSAPGRTLSRTYSWVLPEDGWLQVDIGIARPVENHVDPIGGTFKLIVTETASSQMRGRALAYPEPPHPVLVRWGEGVEQP